MNLYAKKMNNDDIPFIFRVFEQNRAIMHGNYISLDEWQSYFLKGDADPYESHYIITADTTPAAWLKINGWNKPEICISMLVVDDLFKHKGVGKFAIRFAEKEARYWAKSAIRVQTTRDNVIATECYLNCGYEIIREMVYKVGDGVDRKGYEFMKNILLQALTEEKLTEVLSKMLGINVIRTNYQTKQLQGGTLGDVRLVTGTAETVNGENLPYKVVWKKQKKWERPGDPNSWRREYDLYMSELGSTFTDALRWPECYHAEINEEENEIQLWMEYIEGTSGNNLTTEMLEQAAFELGRFQGGLYNNSALLQRLDCLSDINTTKKEYEKWYSEKDVLTFLRSEQCPFPDHICQMFFALEKNIETIFENIEKLPVVFAHKDFWVENIIYTDGKIRLIDWDTTGWGFLGEDIASLIIDETYTWCIDEYYKRLIPAYYKGFSEYADISFITNHCIFDMIIIRFGYRLVRGYQYAKTAEHKEQHTIALQKIYEMRNGK